MASLASEKKQAGSSLRIRNNKLDPLQAGQVSGAAGLRVGFIGNSFTFYNDLPAMIDGLMLASSSLSSNDSTCASARHAPLALRGQVTVGGQDFKGHGQDVNVQRFLTEYDWDFVVLQDHSNVPGGYDASRLRDSHEFLEQKICPALVHKSRILLYQTWGHQHGTVYEAAKAAYPDFSTMSAATARGYQTYAQLLTSLGCSVSIAPVGRAFELIYRQKNDDLFRRLFVPDQFHPSRIGTYLAACVIFACLTGLSPIGLPYLPSGCKLDGALKSKFGANWEPESISSELSRLLQSVAHDAVWCSTQFTPTLLRSPSLASRLLYSAPVCVLSAPLPTESKSADAILNNFMVISWLSLIDNNGRFHMSIRASRFTTQCLMCQGTDSFALSIVTQGLEPLLLKIGSVSGSTGNKAEALQLEEYLVPPGWSSQAAEPEASLWCLRRSAAHIVAQIDRLHHSMDSTHLIVEAHIHRAFVHPGYWRRSSQGSEKTPAVFCPRLNHEGNLHPPLLSFMGSKCFTSNAGGRL